MSEFLVVCCSFPTLESAENVANTLVAERLAACVSLQESVTSIYRWQDALCKEREVSALIKTKASSYAALEARILSLHSYSCPEIIALPILKGSGPYLRWLDEETQPPSEP